MLATVFYSPFGISLVGLLVLLLEFGTLSTVAVLDVRASRRFPWTHWLGVTACLSYEAILVIDEFW